MKHFIVSLVVALCVSACGVVASSPTPQDDATRAAAAVKVALAGAYQTTADLLQAGALPMADAKTVYVNLSQAEAALATAQTMLVSNPTSAQAYIATALKITTDILSRLQAVQTAAPGAVIVPPKVITNGSGS